MVPQTYSEDNYHEKSYDEWRGPGESGMQKTTAERHQEETH